MTIEIPAACSNCERTAMSWFPSLKVVNPIQNGRLMVSDVKPIFVLGCDDCSETLLVVEAEVIAGLLNKAINIRRIDPP